MQKPKGLKDAYSSQPQPSERITSVDEGYVQLHAENSNLLKLGLKVEELSGCM
jgi:hypothetical protein